MTIVFLSINLAKNVLVASHVIMYPPAVGPCSKPET
ncbi:MAG: hypothetical protein RLZZ373_1593 [Pseudomonadota bacterium]